MRFSLIHSLLLAVMATCVGAVGQTPTYNVGQAPTEEEIRAWDISIGPSGKELPPGSGTAKQGAPIYAQKCAACHGPTGTEGWPVQNAWRAAPPLVRNESKLQGSRRWPFATTIWDYINRAMPPKQPDPENPGQFIEARLSAGEVYALTAWLLYRNGIIPESAVIDATTLPKIKMPNRNNFVPLRWEDIRLPRCRGGPCP